MKNRDGFFIWPETLANQERSAFKTTLFGISIGASTRLIESNFRLIVDQHELAMMLLRELFLVFLKIRDLRR